MTQTAYSRLRRDANRIANQIIDPSNIKLHVATADAIVNCAKLYCERLEKEKDDE